MMMKKMLIFMLVFGMTSIASAALTLSSDITIDVGATDVIQVSNSMDGGYGAWIGLTDLTIAAYDGDPTFTAAGNPNGDSLMPKYDAHWYGTIIVSSLNPSAPILAGAHINVSIIGVKEGVTTLELYADDGVTLLDTATITVVPEPMTVALLGLGGLFLLRRRK
jgi:hypothetical protein